MYNFSLVCEVLVFYSNFSQSKAPLSYTLTPCVFLSILVKTLTLLLTVSDIGKSGRIFASCYKYYDL